MKLSIFADCQIALDLGINVGFKKKAELRKTILDNGGIVSYIVTKKSSFVVASDPEKCDVSSKCRMAVKYHLAVVSMDYIWDSVQAGKKLSIDRYTIAGKSKALDFRSGKISAPENKTVSTVRRFTTKPTFNIRSVRAWRPEDAEAPPFDEENYEVAKYALFQGKKKKQDQTTFYVVEIHVGSRLKKKDENDNSGPVYRLFCHCGTLQDAVGGKPCTRELRYVSTADQALTGYTAFYNEQLGTHRMQLVEGTFMRNVGSRKLQQILSVLESETGVASPKEQAVVEHIWREAVGEVDNVLAVPVSSIKLDQIEKAEALLLKIRDLDSDCADVEAALQDFYDTLPHRTEMPGSRKPTRAWLSQKQDLCQLIRDMVSVSEATSWSAQPGVQAKYRAMRCNIAYMEPASQEYERISEQIVSSAAGSVRVNINNIYAVQRPVEDASFRHDLDDKSLLFHSSKVENFLGILSRGLLMPKIVVDDFGGTRTDAGLLGSGIYFASAFSKSALYSTPSKSCGTRLLVVNEVALGRCMGYTSPDTTLQGPPEGYDSVHGIGRSQDETSVFEFDEYVIYNVDQQRLRYLVEFTIDEERPSSVLLLDDVAMEMETTLPAHLAEIDLRDVQGVTDPMSRVKPGLVSDMAEGQVELKAVHVRAKLVDLAAQVVVLQHYVNNSTLPIEAKYVFPLGDGAAVCGFEAFINSKHIVGEVKEKETAHKEYKKAISEGHGAYLMDQDEETPDVFTVSVGNLPPAATVLIKITYVAELQVDAELISFRLPGSVAPWKEDTATKDKTQDKLDTHKVSGGQTSVQVAVEMPFDIRSLECPTHRVRVKRTASKAVVELASGQDITDGFQLLVGLAEIHVPRMWVERHPDRPDHQACMLTFYPEFEVGSEVKTELVLLLDVSNSMKGTSLQSAKKIALLILRSMDPTWTFNVVAFGTRYTEVFPTSQACTDENVATAEKFIMAAQADGGNTEIFRPLHAYFLLPPAEGSTRNVLLLSDGHLNNETSVMADARNNYHHTRIFTFGVSPTCNVYTLKSLARVSAGTFEFFDTKVKSKWEEKVRRQLGKASQPGLTSVAVEWRQYDDNLPPPVQAPRRITALFNGARQVIYGFVPNCTMAFLSAVVGGQAVSTVVSTSELAITTGLIVHRLTARGIIQDWEAGLLSDDRTRHEMAKMNEKQDIIELSKEYSIVTQFTSFVAIEERDKDESQEKTGPSIVELVGRETVDILDYVGWEGQQEEEKEEKEVVANAEFEKASFQIAVKTLAGQTHLLFGKDRTTIEELKQQLSEKMGMHPDHQRLIFAGKQLENQRSLSDYGIDDTSMLHLVERLRGGGDWPIPASSPKATAEDESEEMSDEADLAFGLSDESSTASSSSFRSLSPVSVSEAEEGEEVADSWRGVQVGMAQSDKKGKKVASPAGSRGRKLPSFAARRSAPVAESMDDDISSSVSVVEQIATKAAGKYAGKYAGEVEEDGEESDMDMGFGLFSDEVADSFGGESNAALSPPSPPPPPLPPKAAKQIATKAARISGGTYSESNAALSPPPPPPPLPPRAAKQIATKAARISGGTYNEEEEDEEESDMDMGFGLFSDIEEADSFAGISQRGSEVLHTHGRQRSRSRSREREMHGTRDVAQAASFQLGPTLQAEEPEALLGATSHLISRAAVSKKSVLKKLEAAAPVQFVKTSRNAEPDAYRRAPEYRSALRSRSLKASSMEIAAEEEEDLFQILLGSRRKILEKKIEQEQPASGFMYGGQQLSSEAPPPSSVGFGFVGQPQQLIPQPPPPPPSVGFGFAAHAHQPPPPPLSTHPPPAMKYGFAGRRQQPPPPPPAQPLSMGFGFAAQAHQQPPPPPQPPSLGFGFAAHAHQLPPPPPPPPKPEAASVFGSSALSFGTASTGFTPGAAACFGAMGGQASFGAPSTEPSRPFTSAPFTAAGGGGSLGSLFEPAASDQGGAPGFGSMLGAEVSANAAEREPPPPLRAGKTERPRHPPPEGVPSASCRAVRGMTVEKALETKGKDGMTGSQGSPAYLPGESAVYCNYSAASPSYSPASPSYSPTSSTHVTDTFYEGQATAKYYALDFTMKNLLETEAAKPLLKKKQKKKTSHTRWDSEETFEERKRMQAKREALEAEEILGPDRGFGARVPVVRQGASLGEWQTLWRGNVDELLQRQMPDTGSWKLDEELGRLLCLDVNTCLQLLTTGGIQSFGLTAAEDIRQLLATVLVVMALFLAKTAGQGVSDSEMISFFKDTISFNVGSASTKFTSLMGDFLQKPGISKALEFCMSADSRHPLACSSMELASDWITLSFKLLGIFW